MGKRMIMAPIITVAAAVTRAAAEKGQNTWVARKAKAIAMKVTAAVLPPTREGHQEAAANTPKTRSLVVTRTMTKAVRLATEKS